MSDEIPSPTEQAIAQSANAAKRPLQDHPVRPVLDEFPSPIELAKMRQEQQGAASAAKPSVPPDDETLIAELEAAAAADTDPTNW